MTIISSSSTILVFSLVVLLLLQLQYPARSPFTIVEAADADPLMDFCVADLTKDLYLNGYPCKNPAAVTTDDFVFHGLTVPSQTNTSYGADAVFGFVGNFPGLNSLGIAIARLDFAKGGLIPPHTHPRGSEIIYVLKGSLYAGFVTADNKLFANVIKEGDVMIFPRGLIHFQLNVGDGPAQAIVSLNSQHAGFQLVTNSLFGSGIKDEVLQKTFFLDQEAVDRLKTIFSS